MAAVAVSVAVACCARARSAPRTAKAVSQETGDIYKKLKFIDIQYRYIPE